MAVRIRNYQPALLGLALAGRAGEARRLLSELAGMEHIDLSGGAGWGGRGVGVGVRGRAGGAPGWANGA
jgi:hypothetical protein